MSDLLVQIFKEQRSLQIQSYDGVDPATLDDEKRTTFIKDMVLACEDELHEALGEVGWKPWATSRHVNREAYVGELVDALHFFVNLCLVVGVTPHELFDRYMEKRARNAARQAAGYDGVTGKCPGCGRAMDDPGVKCHRRELLPDTVWCADLQTMVKVLQAAES